MNKRESGRAAEDLACGYLCENGFKILARNYSLRANFHGGEIDIIASKGGRIHFIEVKSRTTDRFGAGREAVNAPKQETIRRLAACWLAKHSDPACSFDVIEITRGHPEHFENCF
jgi:putative endonuclease